jgi:hypothetical protein
MKCNVGSYDSAGRIAVELVLLVVGLAAPVEMALRIVVLAIAALALITALLRFCPIYAAFGINTCESE